MKKLFAIILVLAMILSVSVFSFADSAKEITLWTYPIGSWGNAEAVEALMADFEAATGIKVTVEYLDYTNGDDQVNTALEGGAAPDLIMEGPERLVANWGAKGYMVDLSDLWNDEDKAEVNASCVSACFNAEGKCFEYPVCMTAHCMAINLDAFKAAGADQYVDTVSHTWTTEQFISACKALYDYYGESVCDIYCSGQGGDQGTRAIVNNLYGGTFTNAEHTAYTADSAENVKALELLQSLDAVYFNAAENGGEEITAFRQGLLKMAFCWNIAQQLNTDNNDAGLTNDGEQIVFMSFPSETGVSKLCGGIWGFGIFDNGDAAKVEAAKEFIKYFCDGEGTVPAVKTSTYFAARTAVNGTDISDIWADNAIMNDYNCLMQYLGDYYQVTSGWATARTEWWNMLQRIGDGGTVADEVATFCANANAAAAE